MYFVTLFASPTFIQLHNLYTRNIKDLDIVLFFQDKALVLETFITTIDASALGSKLLLVSIVTVLLLGLLINDLVC